MRIFTADFILILMYTFVKVKENGLPFKGVTRYILSINNHENILHALADFCARERVFCGKVSGIGAINQAVFRFLDPATKQYVDKSFDEQMEITCLEGNISQKDNKPYLHVHLTCSRRDYTCVGGHLLDARVNGACELFVENYTETTACRRADEETGLNMYDFK